MKIGYMIVGCIFLCNPFINIVDILPDFIGYFFILKALSELSDLDRNIRNARKRFQSALWVSVVKCALVFGFMIYDSTWYLILTFSFSVLECMYLIPAFGDLFYGISYLEERHTNHKSRFEAMPKFGGVFDKTEFAGGTAYFEVFEDGRNEAPVFARENVFFADGCAAVSLSEAGFASRFREKIVYLYESAEARTLSVIFVIVRAVCSVLPELTAIAETGDGYVESNPIEDFSALRWILILLLAVFSLAVGIVWLTRMVRYFNIFRKDREFIGILQKKYEAEVLPNQGLWIKRKSLAFCAVATAAYAFLLYLRVDWFLLVPKWEGGGFRWAVYDLLGFFPIPEFLFGAVMIFAGIAAKNFAQRKRELTKYSVVFIISSFLSYIVMTFISRYYGSILYPYSEIGYVILFALYLALFAVSMVMLVKISREKKTIYERLASEIAEISCPCVHEFSDRRRKTMIEEFELKIKRLHILEKVYAVFSVAAVICLPFAGDYDIFGLSWFFRMIFGIALIVYSLFLTDALQKEIEKIVE